MLPTSLLLLLLLTSPGSQGSPSPLYDMVVKQLFETMSPKREAKGLEERAKAWGATTTGPFCTFCLFVVDILKNTAASDQGKLTESALTICIKDYGTPAECQGFISAQMETVFQVLAAGSHLSPEGLCGGLTQYSCGDKHALYWNLTISENGLDEGGNGQGDQVGGNNAQGDQEGGNNAQGDQESGNNGQGDQEGDSDGQGDHEGDMVRRSKDLSRDVKVIHLTDLHVDRDYSGAGKGKCFLGICCKSTNETSDAQVDLGEWGDAQGCGVPLHTFQNLLQHINESHPDVDYIVWTGDTAAHDSWFQSPAANLETVHVVTELIQKALPDVPVYPAVGNHDIFPINQFPGSDEVVGSGDFWFYKSLASIWKEYIPEDQVQGFRTYGNFVVRPVEGLRIVVLNTNYCYKFNWFTYLDHSDPGKQLEWLDRELKSASDAGDHVHLVSHISPGDEDCLVTWTHHFLRLLHKYRGVVKAQFYGHDHDDRFQVMVGDNDTVLGVAFLGPSLTPLRKMNPAYRIYTVDAHSKEVKMLETWWMDLAEANRKGKPAWRRLYNTVTDYRFRPFTLQDWLGFVDDVRREESLFLDYYRHKSRNWPRPPESCNETCRTLNTCNMIVRDPIKYCGAERCKTKSPEECKDFDYY